jgi:hypothetical protein
VASGQNGKFCRPLLKELEERLQREIGIINKSSKPKLNLTFQCLFQRLQAILLRSKFETASLGRIYQSKNINKNPERVIQEKFHQLPNSSLSHTFICENIFTSKRISLTAPIQFIT